MTDLQRAQVELEQVKAELDFALQQARSGESKPDKPHKTPGSERAVDTMFRSAYRVQMDLTSLADNKANMMISINGIVMSIIIASVAPKLDANPWLLLPTVVLLIGNLVSMVFAVMAARPRVARPTRNPLFSAEKKTNLLFFGSFANMREDDFVAGMSQLMEVRMAVYEAMIRNIYGLGSVLYRKFVLLQYAYTSFMIALVLGVSSFVTVFIWLAQQGPK
jgi:hypothetical protein